MALLAGATGCGVAGADGDPAAATGASAPPPTGRHPGPRPVHGLHGRLDGYPAPGRRNCRAPLSASAASVALDGLRPLSGGTPGLYGGIQHVGSCDVTRQIGQLAAHPARKSAFAEVAGVSAAALPAYLRGLTPGRAPLRHPGHQPRLPGRPGHRDTRRSSRRVPPSSSTTGVCRACAAPAATR
ncbi:hypothetical protein LV779_26870 [Streptomyces thinghirensis]|nr:hypothetical protein [Streptomyces thinghirensis]